MAGKSRVEFEGALYHVIARGNHRRDILPDQADWATYLLTTWGQRSLSP